PSAARSAYEPNGRPGHARAPSLYEIGCSPSLVLRRDVIPLPAPPLSSLRERIRIESGRNDRSPRASARPKDAPLAAISDKFDSSGPAAHQKSRAQHRIGSTTKTKKWPFLTGAEQDPDLRSPWCRQMPTP